MNPGVVPGFSVHDEMADLVAAGLTPLQVFRAATVNAAQFLGVPPPQPGGCGVYTGHVSVGCTADLVLFDRNPLDDIANTRRIAGVMLRGRWLDRARLEGLLKGER